MRLSAVFNLVLVFFLSSCSTSSGLLEDKSEGVAKVYKILPAKAWDAARAVLAWEDAYDIEEHSEEGCVTADLPSTFGSYGGVIGVWIEASGKASSKVTVLTRRKMATTVGTPLTEAEFHERFAKAVKIIKAGKKLPEKTPD